MPLNSVVRVPTYGGVHAPVQLPADVAVAAAQRRSPLRHQLFGGLGCGWSCGIAYLEWLQRCQFVQYRPGNAQEVLSLCGWVGAVRDRAPVNLLQPPVQFETGLQSISSSRRFSSSVLALRQFRSVITVGLDRRPANLKVARAQL